MSNLSIEIEKQEELVNNAFSKQSLSFDEIDETNPIVLWMRKTIREHELSILQPNNYILELNAGTGLDAAYFANKGFKIHATDNSEGMLNELNKKINHLKLQDKITIERCSFNQLEKLGEQKFDHIFSNFGGLNCASDLSSVIKKMEHLLNPNGTVTLVIMPMICPWEIALALKGNFKIAFRRFNKKGAKSHLEGVYFKTYYYSSAYIKRAFGPNYKTMKVKGISSIAPPPYLDKLAINFPKLFKLLTKLDERVCELPPFRSWADHLIITVQKIN